MARTYTRIKLSVWRDIEFTDLTIEAQGCYWMLISQRSLSFAGCLPFQPAKWARLAKNATADSVGDALNELVQARFALVDNDTEEVLIRGFIKHDGGARNPNLAKAIETAISKIDSDHLRSVAQHEFDRASTKEQVTDSDEGPSPDPNEGPCEGDTEGLPEATYIPNPSSCIPQPSSSIPHPSTASSSSQQNLRSQESDHDDDDRLEMQVLELLASAWTKANATKGNERAYRRTVMANAWDHLPGLRQLIAERPNAKPEAIAKAYESGGWSTAPGGVNAPHDSTCVCDGTGMVPVDPDNDTRSGFVRRCTATPGPLASVTPIRATS